MTMQGADDREERQWLGGEAHVRRYDGRPKRPVLWRSLISGTLPLLAGTALGSLGAVGLMKADAVKRRKRMEERGVRIFSERRDTMESVQADERRVREAEDSALGFGTIVAAFGLGLLTGAAVMLLTTPESGVSVRTRLKRGVDTARQELDEIVEESKGSWSLVRDDAREAVKRTAARIKEAAKVTKEALAEGKTSAPKAP